MPAKGRKNYGYIVDDPSSFYWLYLFIDEGILRVEIVSRARHFGFVLGAILIFLVLLVPVFILSSQGAISSTFGILIVVLGLGPVVGSPYFIISLRRRGLTALKFEQLAERKLTLYTPWINVKEIQVKHRGLTIRTEGRTFRASIRESNLEAVKGFIQSKIGDRLVVQQ